ncbi:alpha-1,4-N-acetylglucosaminyltransferase-like [Hyperolius riggenbachi]|uniref:alpha-1,4-N-acetylglucosaminyltransferase-like n=1 Tax=Hyperolius riggenbachi TaxID=752182 RepID=UPI0035A269C0
MIKGLKFFLLLLLIIVAGYIYKSNNIGSVTHSIIATMWQGVVMGRTLTGGLGKILPSKVTSEDILSKGENIVFLETTDRMQVPSLVLCAIESAARVYPDRQVVFFMKGLNHTNSEDDAKRALSHYPTLSSLENVHIYPLNIEELFNNTPLLQWYTKVDNSQEKFWTHVKSDGCRLAVIWKYGGIYMDSDVISLRPIPNRNFLASEASGQCTNSVFGFPARHNFPWIFMEDFVKKYNGNVWGNQGPILFTRVFATICPLPNYKGVEDLTCGNISLLHPQRFYPIGYPGWRSYYKVWDKLPAFNYSHGLHLWNFMNRIERIDMVPGSNTLIEHLYQQYCPSTYAAIQRNASTYI